MSITANKSFIPTHPQARIQNHPEKEPDQKRNDNLSFTGTFSLEYNELKEPVKWIYKNNKIEQAFFDWGKKTPDWALGFIKWNAKFANKNPALYEVLTLIAISFTLRPITIMAVPGAKKEDKQYAAVKSVSTALVSGITSYLLYKPWNTFLNKILNLIGENYAKAYEKAKESNTIKDLSKKIPLPPNIKGLEKLTAQITRGESFHFVFCYGAKFIFGIIDAYFLFKFIPPLMKIIFPKKDTKKFDPTPVLARPLSEEQIKTKLDPAQQKVFNALMQFNGGGIKQ